MAIVLVRTLILYFSLLLTLRLLGKRQLGEMELSEFVVAALIADLNTLRCSVNPYNLRHPRRDDVLVALAGPFSNLILAVVTLLIVRLLPFISEQQAAVFFQYLIFPMAAMSVMLCVFNLLPIPPLDGSHLLFSFLPQSLRQYYGKISLISFILMIVLINTPVWRYFGMIIQKILLLGLRYIGGVEF